MPIPTPQEDETQQEYVSRGMGWFSDEDTTLEHDQQLAALYDKWDREKESFEIDLNENIVSGIEKYAEDTGVDESEKEKFVKGATSFINSRLKKMKKAGHKEKRELDKWIETKLGN